MEPIIRALQKEDVLQLPALFLQLTEDSVFVDADLLLTHEECRCFVIYMDQKIIGFGALVVYYLPSVGEVGKIEDIIIDEKYRGNGFGRRLLEKLISVAKENNVKKLQLTSSPRRTTARALYQSLGFKMKDTNVFVMDLE